jgi:hypothetical protein
LNSPPPPFSLTPTPIPGVVSTGIIFPFTYICTQYLCCIHSPMSFPHLLPPSTGTSPSGRTCPTLLFSDFVKVNKYHFCLFKIVTQGFSLWYFHAYMYYNPNWFMSSIFLSTVTLIHCWWECKLVKPLWKTVWRLLKK